MAQYNSKANDNRICYVDPNDVRGNINGAPLTPDYTEYSIWCNLRVEPTTRLRNQAGATNGEMVMSWNMSNANMSNNPISFLRGKDADNYNFLTTDYTNIDYNEVRKRNIVEGLQVESVNISFTNYQTPQITIKFIDIRGGGFFGREEATHNEYGALTNLETDKSGKLMDNIFSCFVSFPYPRFQLQVKGFYGKTVTYQLSCTNFSGNFNSQTGNFEITVQFIGYEYGILGDIPFDLLVAAPLTDFGRKYWNEHLSSEDWALDKDKTEIPQMLNDIYKKISGQITGTDKEDGDDDSSIDDSISTVTLDTAQRLQKLNEIKFYISEFKKCANELFGKAYLTQCCNDLEDTIIVYNPTQMYHNTTKLNDLCDIRNKIARLVEEYNKAYTSDGGSISLDVIPNNDGNGTNWVPGNPLTFTSFIEHSDVNGHHNNLVNSDVIDSDGVCKGFILQRMFTGGNYEISEGVSKQIYHDLSTTTWALYGKDTGTGLAFAPFALAITLGNTKKEIDGKITRLNENYNRYVYNLKNQADKGISKMLDFTPYIGRYFKIVMCHLETFVALIFHYAQAIEDDMDNRIPSKMGIRDLPVETDVPGDFTRVPPFPAVYKKYMTEGEIDKILNSGESIKANTWIGDFEGRWIEEELVNEIYRAAQRINETRKKEDIRVSYDSYTDYNYNSFMPVDYYEKIPQYAYSSSDGAFFYAALRAEIALNLMQNGKSIATDKTGIAYAEMLGRYDAYVYAKQCKDKQFLRQLSENNKLSDELYNTTVYESAFKSREPFFYEFLKLYNDNRHPVFVPTGEGATAVKYAFMQNDANNREFIPLENYSTLNKSNSFASSYDYNSGTDFEPKKPNGNKFLVAATGNDPIPANTYPNTHHFEMIMNSTAVDKIKTSYSEFKKGNEKIGNKTSKDIDKALNQHMLVDDNRFKTFYFDGQKNWFKPYDFTKEGQKISDIINIY